MSYIGEIRKTAFESFGVAASALVLAAAVRSISFLKAVARRRIIADLGEFDDRMLRDIGLNRSDLRDAAAAPMWQDPTRVLVVRAVEKRAARRMAQRELGASAAGSTEAVTPASATIGCG